MSRVWKIKGFSHFSPSEKKCEVASHSGSALLPESSPSTPTAQLEVKQSQEEAEAERLEDELLACQLEQRYPEDCAPYSAPDGRTHFRHRLSGRSR